MGDTALRCSGEEMGGLVLKPDLHLTPDLQLGALEGFPCQASKRTLRSQQAHRQAGSAPPRRLLEQERGGLGRPEGNRKCKAAGERVSGVAGVDYEEYWTLSGRGCLMCSPEKYRWYSEEITVTPYTTVLAVLFVQEACVLLFLFDGKNENQKNYESHL